MFYNQQIAVGMSGGEYIGIIPKMANRHGLIAGATGTGKTVTLKVMAESLSDAGVPVFLADVKGDIAGMCAPGEDSADMQARIRRFALADKNFGYRSYPVRFWDIYGEKGLPLRTTVTEFGPLLLARILDLNQTQTDILNIIFRIADEKNLLLIDMKDLKAMLGYVSENASGFRAEYGNLAPQSISAIMRSLVALEDRGADRFFGEPALDIHDWFRKDTDGRGVINILDSQSAIQDPAIYATFLLWMMSELFEVLPEVGDLEKPQMVFFFDEAHLLFKDAPKALLQKVEQVVKLIRSKGVGIYFVTQNPRDIPDAVLAQLGNKVQHALHAYTPAEQKGLRAAADSFRENPAFQTEDAIRELKTGEAVVSFLQADGSPSVAQIVSILPPQSKMGPIDDTLRERIIETDALKRLYAEMFDRDSAYELLKRKSDEETARKVREKEEKEAEKAREKAEKEAAKEAERAEKEAQKAREKEEKEAAKAAEKEAREKEKEKQKKDKTVKTAASQVAQSAVGTVGREVGKTIGGTFGGKFGKTLGGNIGAQLGRGLMQTLFRLK